MRLAVNRSQLLQSWPLKSTSRNNCSRTRAPVALSLVGQLMGWVGFGQREWTHIRLCDSVIIAYRLITVIGHDLPLRHSRMVFLATNYATQAAA